MKALPGQSGATRLDHLRAYIGACLRDNVLKPGDLVSLRLLDKLRTTMAEDIKQIARDAGAGLLQMASLFLGGARG